MSTIVNVDILSKLHEEDGFSIVDGGHLPYRVEVEHHDVCKALKIWWKGICVETSSFSNTTNIGLNHLYGEHSVLERSEVMIYVSMSKNIINVPHFKFEFMAFNLTIKIILL